jgi:hypothetical protein
MHIRFQLGHVEEGVHRSPLIASFSRQALYVRTPILLIYRHLGTVPRRRMFPIVMILSRFELLNHCSARVSRIYIILKVTLS